MRWSIAFLMLAFLISGCSGTQLAVHATKSVIRDGTAPQNNEVKVGKPYKIKGIWYYPHVQPNYSETGLASWYGRQFHGRLTANGEVYDMNGLTAAHKTLPLPSMVRVTNLENGRSLVLRVNDRGPFVHGRIIDVSRRAAELLGFRNQGVAKVRVTLTAESRVASVGSTLLPSAAALPKPAQRPVDLEGRAVANDAAARQVESQELAPLPGSRIATENPPPDHSQVRIASAEPRQPLSDVEVAPLGQVQQAAVTPSNLYIQAGAFLNYENAHILSSKLSPYGRTRVEHVMIQNQEFFRVRLGPIAGAEQAQLLLNQIIGNGVPHAKLIVD